MDSVIEEQCIRINIIFNVLIKTSEKKILLYLKSSSTPVIGRNKADSQKMIFLNKGCSQNLELNHEIFRKLTCLFSQNPGVCPTIPNTLSGASPGPRCSTWSLLPERGGMLTAGWMKSRIVGSFESQTQKVVTGTTLRRYYPFLRKPFANQLKVLSGTPMALMASTIFFQNLFLTDSKYRSTSAISSSPSSRI